MDIDIFLSTIGINNYDTNIKYLVRFNLIILLLSFTPLFYGIYNIFTLKSTDQILQCMMMAFDLFIYYNIIKVKSIKYIKRFLNEDTNPVIKNKYIYPSFTITIFTSFIAGIIFSILSYNDYNIKLIDQLTDIKYLKCVFSFLYFYYSFQIKIYSSIIFFVIFYIISMYLNDYSELLSSNNYSIPDICQQFIEIRHKSSLSVSHLNDILSNNIIFNYIPSTLLLINLFEGRMIDQMTIFSSLYFYFSIVTFHFILKKINDSIDKIKYTIDSNRYLRIFLERKRDSYNLDIELEQLNTINGNQINFKNYLLEIENGDSIDWMIINTIASQPWKSFEIFGYEVKNNNILSKLLSLIILLWIGKSII